LKKTYEKRWTGRGVRTNSFFRLIAVDIDDVYDGIIYNTNINKNINNTMTRVYIGTYNIIWPTDGLEKRWRDTNRLPTRILTYYTSTRCGDALYARTPPAAHEFENRITQTPCRRLCVLSLCCYYLYTQYDLQLPQRHYTEPV
jgi:hypothetical protein